MDSQQSSQLTSPQKKTPSNTKVKLEPLTLIQKDTQDRIEEIMQKVKDQNMQRQLSFTQTLDKTFNQAQKSVSFIDLSTGKIKQSNEQINIQESHIAQIHKGSLTERKVSYTQRNEVQNIEGKDYFMQTMDQLLTERLSKVDKNNKKDFPNKNEQQQRKHVNSLSPFKNVRLSRDSTGIFNQTQNMQTNNKSVSTLRQNVQRPQNSQDPNKRKQYTETKSKHIIQQSLFNQTLTQIKQEPQSLQLRSPIVQDNGLMKQNSNQTILGTKIQTNTQQEVKSQQNLDTSSQIIEDQNDNNDDEKLQFDTFIEDTFISNMQKLMKLKKKLIECTKEYRQYTFTHSPRRQHSRIIESLGLNPLDKMPKRRPRISKDPNIVYFEIDCSDKFNGARDIIEIKCNKSPPLLLNTRIQTHYELQYSNYTGLLNSLTERSSGITQSQVMLSKLSFQLNSQNAMNKLNKKSQNSKHQTEHYQKRYSPLTHGSNHLSHQSDLTPNFKHQKFIFQEATNPLFAQPQTAKQQQSLSQILPQLQQQTSQGHPINSAHLNSSRHIDEISISNNNNINIQSNITIDQQSNKIKDDQSIILDFGFADSHKSYLQTLEEFSQKLSNYDKYKPKGQDQGNFYDIQSEILNKAYKIDQGYSLIDSTNLQKLLIEMLPNYKECLMRLIKVMPVTGCLMHQLVSFLMYQLDRSTRVFMSKEKNYLDTITKLEDINKQLKSQINATKEITTSYQKLEKDYHDLSERYSKRIEQSHEVADQLSKDIIELQYNFRNTSLSQIDSQDELQKKLEIIIKQFTMDREQNSFKIGELKSFLDKNISMLKNNWDDKRDKETQTNFEEILSEQYGIESNNTKQMINMSQNFGKGIQENENMKLQQIGLWNIINQYIDQNKMKSKFNIGNELVTYREFLQTTEDIIRHSLKYKECKDFPKYQQVLMDYFLDQSDNTSQDYMRQAISKISQYALIFNHFLLRGGLAVCSIISKYHFNYTQQFELPSELQQQRTQHSHIYMQQLFESITFSLNQSIQNKKLFNEIFPVGDLYENRDRQAEGYQLSKNKNGLDPIQIYYLFYNVLQKDILNEKIKEQSIQNVQRLQFLQILQNQIVLTQETPDQPLNEVPAHMKAIFLIIAQIEYNNETVLDKRLWLMTLVKKLIKKDKSTCFSYDNLIGNFKDGAIGKKLKSQIFGEFFEKHNPDRDFYESFYSQTDDIFQDQVVDSQFNMLSTQPVPVHTKSQTPGFRSGSISKYWKKDTTRAREALCRIVKRISILKRLTIIRKVNEVIYKITSDNDYDDNYISFKKIVKILNLCHIYIPLIQVKANNSTDLSLDIKDMLELTIKKDKYKRFVLLQAESLELIVKGFNIPITVNNLFLLLTRYIIDKHDYFLSPIEVSGVLVECYNSHIQLREIYLKNMFYEKLKSDYSGLVRPQLEQFLFEELGIDNLNESHKILFKSMMTKLKSKLDHNGVITKAIVNEQKVIYKYKDIEESIIKKLSIESIMQRINNTDIMKILKNTMKKINNGKIVHKIQKQGNTNMNNNNVKSVKKCSK